MPQAGLRSALVARRECPPKLYCPPKLLTAILWSCTVWLFPLWEFRPATISGRRQAHVAIISSQFPPRCFLFLLLSWSDAYLMLCDGDADANSAALPVTAKNCQVPVNGFESSWDARGYLLLMSPTRPHSQETYSRGKRSKAGLINFPSTGCLHFCPGHSFICIVDL